MKMRKSDTTSGIYLHLDSHDIKWGVSGYVCKDVKNIKYHLVVLNSAFCGFETKNLFILGMKKFLFFSFNKDV